MQSTSKNSSIINYDEILKKMRFNMFGNLVAWPIILMAAGGWALVSGKAREIGTELAAWIALGGGLLSFLIYIYTQLTLPNKQGANLPSGNVTFRFLLRLIEVISISFAAVPALCTLLEHLFRFKITIPYPYNWLGLVLLVPGAAFVTWTVYTYISKGKGTAIPYEPSQYLVTGGPYRYTRNPMVIGSYLIIPGLVVILSSYILLILVVMAIKESRKYAVQVEEKELEYRFGQAYLNYKNRVPRWFPWRQKNYQAK